MVREQLANATGAEVRAAVRAGQITGTTAGLAMGYAQANLVVLPRELAFDFLLFCRRNPKPCPVLDVTDPGSPEPKETAPGADLRTDLPRYRVYHRGELVEEPTDITALWRDDFVAFLIGCSFTFEAALVRAGVPLRHLEEAKTVPMYRTTLATKPAGMFRGPMVVSMRPLTPQRAIHAVQVSSRYPAVHGAPVHLGDPAAIGIEKLDRPDFGEAVTIGPGEIPVFWACGVTPQAVVMQVRPEIVITHTPGCMFVTDVRDESLAVG